MRLRLNLATNPLETQRRFLVGSGLVAFFAAVVFLWLGWHVYTVRKVDEEFRTRTEKTRQEMAKLEVQRQELDRFFHQEENAKLKQIVAELTLENARLQDVLEDKRSKHEHYSSSS